MKRSIRKAGKAISIEDYAFYLGAQGVPAKEGLAEIGHRFSQQRSKIEGMSVVRQTPHKIVLERSAAIKEQVETAWEEVLNQFGNYPPPVLLAYIMAILGAVALIVDAVLTGPSLDALNVTEPVVQYISAFAIACLAAVTFHLVSESFQSRRMDSRTRWGYRALGFFAVVGLLCWGLLRGYQVAFGADLAGNPLGHFLGGHFFLSSTVFCFITLGSPMAAAFSVGHSVPQIQDSAHWEKAKSEYQQLVDSTSKAQKALEAEQRQTEYELSQLTAERSEWQSCFLQYHRRGQERGGHEEPHWIVVAKAVGVVLASGLIAMAAGSFFWPIYVLPPVAGCVAYIHFRRTRQTPNYRKFRRQEATKFSVPSSPQPALALPQIRTIEARLEEVK